MNIYFIISILAISLLLEDRNIQDQSNRKIKRKIKPDKLLAKSRKQVVLMGDI